MFSIDNAVSQWRAELIRTGKFSSPDIDELEDHLLSLWEERCQQGLAGEEAFVAASGQVGQTGLLAREYARNSLTGRLQACISDESVLIRSVGAIIALGGLCHVFYGVRFLWRLGNDVNTGFLLLFGVIAWSVWKGVQLLRGRAGGSLALLVFFLAQVPVIYLPEFRYDFFSGLAFTLNIGDAPGLIGYGLGGKLYVHAGTTRAFAFIGINFYALAVVTLMAARLLLRQWSSAKHA